MSAWSYASHMRSSPSPQWMRWQSKSTCWSRIVRVRRASRARSTRSSATSGHVRANAVSAPLPSVRHSALVHCCERSSTPSNWPTALDMLLNKSTSSASRRRTSSCPAAATATEAGADTAPKLNSDSRPARSHIAVASRARRRSDARPTAS
eukprot:scaffold22741_cov111-Isochrysis_galbana.AAC.1